MLKNENQSTQRSRKRQEQGFASRYVSLSEFEKSRESEPYAVSVYTPKYPYTAERELARVAESYAGIAHTIIKHHYSEIRSWNGNRETMTKWLDGLFFRMLAELEVTSGRFNLEKRLYKNAELVEKRVRKEWETAVEKTLNVPRASKRYGTHIFQSEINEWVAENMTAVREIPKSTIQNARYMVKSGIDEFKNADEIVDGLDAMCMSRKAHTRRIMRNRVASLNSLLSKELNLMAHSPYYVWHATSDKNTRGFHVELNGNVFRWDNPPQMYRYTPYGPLKTGKYCNPGEDYGCRCVAVPIVNVDWISGITNV